MIQLHIKCFLFSILCFSLSVQNASAIDISAEKLRIIKEYYAAAKEANAVYEAADTEEVGDDAKAYLAAFAHAARLRAEAVEKNLKLAEERFAEFEKLEAQINRLATKYKLPEKHKQLIRVSGNKSVENVGKTLEDNWKKTLINLDAETTKIKKMTTGVNNIVKTVATASGAVNDLWTVGNEVYETITDTDREWSENFKSTVEILKTGLPYASQAATGPLMAAEISAWVYETSMNYYMDKMRALGEERIAIMFEAEKSFRTDVKLIIDDEILNKSRGKTQIEVEANIRKRIATRSQELAKRFDYRGGDFYKIVFGDCEKYIFCAEAAMNKLTGGALADNYRQLQDYVTGFILPDSPQLIQHLKDRKIPELIKNTQDYYQATDELYKQREELQNQISKLAPIKVDLPPLPSIGSGTTPGYEKNIQTSVALTKPTISPATIEAGKTITISTTADKEIPSNKAVFLVINNNEAQPIKMTALSVTRWSYDLVVSKAGSHQVKVYLGTLDGTSSAESSSSSSTAIKVTPAAKATKVVPDKADVVDGSSMKFTATVSGNVDEANGDQVLLWLDSYKQAMQRVSGTQTWTTTVTNIVGVNGKRDYTARVQNGDLYSTDAPHGTLTVKLSDALLVVDAYDISPQPKRIDKAKLNDHVNFIVDSVGAVNGSIKIKINNWISQPLVNIGANKWKTAESIPLQQAEVKTYYAFVEVKGQEASKSTAKVITVTKDSGLVCPAVASTGDLYDAELLVDRRNESIKNAVLHIDACNGKSDDKTITFSESGSGWKWPGIRIADNYCGTFKVSVTSSKNSYTCVTKVNLGSSSPPIVPPATSNDSALLSSNGVQYRLSERLISGDVWQISLTIESKPADFSLVKGKFSGSGLLTVSGTSAGTVFFTQAGNSWTYQVKGTPGTYSYTPVFKIGTKTFDAPARTFTITNNQNSAPRIPEGSVQCVIQPSNTGQMKFDCSLSNSALSSDVAKLSLQCSDAFSFNIPKVSSNSYMASIDFPVGNRTCDISAHGTNHSIFPFTTNLTISAADIHERNIALGKQLVNQLYKEFAGSYNDKNDSKLRGMLSDDWESVGDGTTLADLEMNLRSSFRIFDQVSYTIQNLQISPVAYGRFRVTYDALIKGQIYKSRIKHEEKSSVSEEVEVDPNGKAKITKTLSGRFWYVQ